MRTRRAGIRWPPFAAAPAQRRSWKAARVPSPQTSGPTAKQGYRLRRGGLVNVGEIAERAQHFLRVFALAHPESVEAALLHRMQVVPRDFADRAQLALVAVALAQQAPDRVAAPVAELREIDRDHARQA